MDPFLVAVLTIVAALAGAGIAAAIVFTLVTKRSRAQVTTGVAAEQTRFATEQARLAAEQLRRTAELETQAQEQLKRHREALETSLARERELARTDREAAKRELTQAAEVEDRARRREAKLGERESALDHKLEAVDARDARLRDQEQTLVRRDQTLVARVSDLDQREAGIETKLAAVAELTRDQAREEILKRLDLALVGEQSERIARHEKDVTARAKEIGIEIVGRAIQRYAAEHTAETTSAKIKLADEEMKGRIIGKEGRNIKSFEQATGVDLLIDETPGTIVISCFSGLRREMARRTLTVLIEDGRIHPGRIEEVMAKVQQDMDREVLKLGEDAAFATEVSGLHPQLLRLLGKLQYRTSYGQNVLQHTQEVAFLCGAMAADLGLDPKLGRRCGLMHDIGKAIDHEQEGSHPELGHEALKRYGESEIVANAALAHHEGHAVLSAYTVLAAAADAISAARPGARSKNVEGYIKRLEKLEEIACSYSGVQKAYAIQAGRELRVIVSGREIPDAELPKLARDIARRIEDEVAFPGEVKVTIIREMRHFAVAR